MSDYTKIDDGNDVVAFLKAQHDLIKELFERVTSSEGAAREEAFTDLRRLLAVHETAEEEVVHPRAKSEIEDGEAIVSARLEEEREAKETLAELEKLDLNSAEFQTKFAQFRNDVVAHAEAEEREEFSRLADELDDAQLERMRTAARLAEKTAPTHPHAGVESAPANLTAGPFAAMLDRAKDLITGRR
jgi:hemerythrin superfamily protein